MFRSSSFLRDFGEDRHRNSLSRRPGLTGSHHGLHLLPTGRGSSTAWELCQAWFVASTDNFVAGFRSPAAVASDPGMHLVLTSKPSSSMDSPWRVCKKPCRSLSPAMAAEGESPSPGYATGPVV